MNIDDLLKALHGANVTINIQGGEHNTMYTAPVQKNRYGDSERRRNDPRCSICGHSDGDLWRDSFWKSYYHPSCRDDKSRQTQLERPVHKSRIARSHEQVSASSAPMLPKPDAPPIAEPVEAEVIDPQVEWDRDALIYLCFENNKKS